MPVRKTAVKECPCDVKATKPTARKADPAKKTKPAAKKPDAAKATKPAPKKSAPVKKTKPAGKAASSACCRPCSSPPLVTKRQTRSTTKTRKVMFHLEESSDSDCCCCSCDC
ncbi:unnamed protein product [Phyllotreta striolata]|uniref:Uncharacterized protein n=1 Tax=Phyllotreta striolata TaxID=444603 RepID=A0A9N9TFW7_PHYSR|nr:unnamed protein product [Phyllotreta striolata]